jgi:hypothetical protein
MYAAALAVGIPLWWALMSQLPAMRAWFVPEHAWHPFHSFVWPDMVLAGACAVFARRLWRGAAVGALPWFIGGAWAYVTAFVTAWTIDVDAPWTGLLLMLAGGAGLLAILHDWFPDRP